MNKIIWPPQLPSVDECQEGSVSPSLAVRQAVIMAGGKGTRLHPYSAIFPKPLMPLGDMPIMELLLRRLKAAGIVEVIVAVNHLRHLIEVYFGDGSDLGMRLYYSDEEKPLGTAGALGNMLPMLDETFLVTNGDLLTTMDLRMMAASHIAERADASVGIFERENKIDFGLIEFDAANRLSAYREKPTSKYYVSMGVYILQREAVRPHITDVDYLDMPNLLLKIKESNGSVVCFRDSECTWLDIGRPDDFALAQKMFEDNREAFLGHA
jgi:NDP-sugar pyrophosphorylase family protein